MGGVCRDRKVWREEELRRSSWSRALPCCLPSFSSLDLFSLADGASALQQAHPALVSSGLCFSLELLRLPSQSDPPSPRLRFPLQTWTSGQQFLTRPQAENQAVRPHLHPAEPSLLWQTLLCGQELLWRRICFLLGPEGGKALSESQAKEPKLGSSQSFSTHSELAANSRGVLDLPHALRKPFEEGASAVLQLVADVRNDVVGGEVASAEEAANSHHTPTIGGQSGEKTRSRTSDEYQRRRPGLASCIRCLTCTPGWT